jgi:hypothetical protein
MRQLGDGFDAVGVGSGPNGPVTAGRTAESGKRVPLVAAAGGIGGRLRALGDEGVTGTRARDPPAGVLDLTPRQVGSHCRHAPTTGPHLRGRRQVGPNGRVAAAAAARSW